jgi:hypothetical protein
MSTNEKANNHLIRTKEANEALAEYHLEVYSRARQFQAMRSGLLSNEDAIRIATFEHFSKGLIAMTMSLRHANLFGGESKEEQIKAMMDYGIAAASDKSNSSSELASSIITELFDKLCSTDNNNPKEQKEQEQQVASGKIPEPVNEREEACFP